MEKREVEINGLAGSLNFDGDALVYDADGRRVELPYQWVPTSGNRYTLLAGTQVYSIAFAENGAVFVNGREYKVEVSDPRSLRGRRTGAEAGGRKNICAPMPGRVVRLLVEAGQEVEAGQGLIVVEAMKMQNEIKAPAKGRLVEVSASAGAAVAAGQILMVIE